ncbi:unnamed protein product, partial [Soboliphyme baturini]|uniref:Homeobox domain-containing protein n=1 Tax=Soboliphyme baturini TaxID=241478 RepID=A0A183IJM0_9BILA
MGRMRRRITMIGSRVVESLQFDMSVKIWFQNRRSKYKKMIKTQQHPIGKQQQSSDKSIQPMSENLDSQNNPLLIQQTESPAPNNPMDGSGVPGSVNYNGGTTMSPSSARHSNSVEQNPLDGGCSMAGPTTLPQSGGGGGGPVMASLSRLTTD